MWNLKTGTYATDVTVVNYSALKMEIESVPASKYGNAKNTERLINLLIDDLLINTDLISNNKLIITPDVSTNLVTLDYTDLRYPWERMSFLQHVRLIVQQLSDDIVIISEDLKQTILSSAKLAFNSTPIITIGNTNIKAVFDVIGGYPDEPGGGLDIYKKMFIEWVAFQTNGGIDIADFGSGNYTHLSASFDTPTTPSTWTIDFDLTITSAEKNEEVYQMISICEGGIPNTYVELLEAGAILAS